MAFSFTARDIIKQAQKTCGVLGIGQTMNAEDTNDALIALQNLIAQWQSKRWLVPSLFDIAMPGNNAISNQIGDGQYWNTPRPDKIMAAYFLQNNNTQVSFPLYPMYSYEDYTRITLKQLNSFPRWYFYDGAFPYGNVFIWPIPSPGYEIHLILPSQLGFSTTITSGSITVAGTDYTDGVYVAVPLINLVSSQNGISATANVTVAGGIVTAFEIQNGGELYKVGDTVTLDTAIVGVGTGFIYTVTGTQSDLDSVMSLPPEYMRAMIFNLAIELHSMYQTEPTRLTEKIARTSLKTIIAANTQIPELRLSRLPYMQENNFLGWGGGDMGIPEAPNNGIQYGRQSQMWTPSTPEAPDDNVLYGRKNASWIAIIESGITISDTPPVSPSASDLWFDSTAGGLYMFYNDGTTSQWVGV